MKAPSPAAVLIAAAVVALALLAGCGEKEEPETTGPVVTQTTTGSTGIQTTTQTTTAPDDNGQSDRQFVSQAATSFLSSPKAAAVCDAGVTAAFLHRAYGDRAGCLAARRPASLASSAQLSDIQIDQGTATLTADAQGGVYGTGQKLKMSLLGDGTGVWRIDGVESNVPVGP